MLLWQIKRILRQNDYYYNRSRRFKQTCNSIANSVSLYKIVSGTPFPSLPAGNELLTLAIDWTTIAKQFQKAEKQDKTSADGIPRFLTVIVFSRSLFVSIFFCVDLCARLSQIPLDFEHV